MFQGADSWFPLSVRKIYRLYLVFESRACFECCLSELRQGVSQGRVPSASRRPLSGKHLFAPGLAVLFSEAATGRQHFRQPRSARVGTQNPSRCGVPGSSGSVQTAEESPESLSVLPPRPFSLTTTLPPPPPGSETARAI